MESGLKYGKEKQIGETVKDEKYLRWIRAQPCVVCSARQPYSTVDPHHANHGGKSAPRQRDDIVVPLCRGCHSWLHNEGQKKAQEKLGKDFIKLARKYRETYLKGGDNG